MAPRFCFYVILDTRKLLSVTISPYYFFSSRAQAVPLEQARRGDKAASPRHREEVEMRMVVWLRAGPP